MLPPLRGAVKRRAPRNIGPSFAPLPRLTNPWAPLEILDAEQVERILGAAFQILEEADWRCARTAAREVCAAPVRRSTSRRSW
jgi:trimethylamine--corrinoid protein Co-methyltransferase